MNMKTLPILLVAAFLLACGGGSASSTTAPPGPAPNAATVQATPAIAFSPGTTRIAAGGTVTFAFGALAHNVFFRAQSGAPADIPGINANTSVARTFTTPGSYQYDCHIHPGMRGTVVVQ
jgi:plastocyanin